MSKKEELDKLSLKMEEEKKAICAKYRVLDQLGNTAEGYVMPFVHYCKLYGTAGSIHFQHCSYESIRKGRNPDRELLDKLLKQFPPFPLVQVKDGCRSFRPATQEWKGELLDVCPVTIRIETLHQPMAKFQWVSKLGEELWRFVVDIPLWQTTLGSLTMKAKRWPDGKVIRWETCSFLPSNNDLQVIRWASGSLEYPNEFTLWTDLDSGKAIDWAAYVKESD